MTSTYCPPDPFQQWRKPLEHFRTVAFQQDFQCAAQAAEEASRHFATLLDQTGIRAISDANKAFATLLDQTGIRVISDTDKTFASLLDQTGIRAIIDTNRALAQLIDSGKIAAFTDAGETEDDERQRRQDINMIELFGSPNREFRVVKYRQLTLQMRPPG